MIPFPTRFSSFRRENDYPFHPIPSPLISALLKFYLVALTENLDMTRAEIYDELLLGLGQKFEICFLNSGEKFGL